jgi:hypothetical protein
MRFKEFGQRPGSTITRESLREMQAIRYERTHDEEQATSSARIRKMVFFVGAAVLMIGIYVGTKGSGQGLTQFWKSNSRPVAASPFVPINAKDVFLDMTNSTCKAHGEAAGKGNAVRTAAAYVACLANDNPKRLCQATHRTHFLAAMTNYYRLQRKDREIKVSADVVEAIKMLAGRGFIPQRDLVATGVGNLDMVLRNVATPKSGC